MNKDLWKNQWHRLGAVAAAVLAVIFLIVGWWGVSGADLTTEQIPYLASGAVGGLFLLGLAATLWLSADLRDEYLKLDDIYQVVDFLGNGSSGAGSRDELTYIGSDDGYGDDDDGATASKAAKTRRPLRSGK